MKEKEIIKQIINIIVNSQVEKHRVIISVEDKDKLIKLLNCSRIPFMVDVPLRRIIRENSEIFSYFGIIIDSNQYGDAILYNNKSLHFAV